MERAFFGSH
jgi:hypothetical protein